MALIACSDCGNQVSIRAASCPKCGAPVTATIGESIGRTFHAEHSERPTTVELTSKPIKLWILLSGLGVVIGLIACVTSLDNPERSAGWLVFAIVSFVVYVFAKAARWWVNG